MRRNTAKEKMKENKKYPYKKLNRKLSIFATTIPSRILIEINKPRRDKNMTVICKKSETSYANSYKTIRELENMGLVTSEKLTRNRNVDITEKGAKVAMHIVEIQKLLKGGGENEWKKKINKC